MELYEIQKSEELREKLGLEPVSLMIKKSSLRWFEHAEHKDDIDWARQCMTSETEGISQRGSPKTWSDCIKNDKWSKYINLHSE